MSQSWGEDDELSFEHGALGLSGENGNEDANSFKSVAQVYETNLGGVLVSYSGCKKVIPNLVV